MVPPVDEQKHQCNQEGADVYSAVEVFHRQAAFGHRQLHDGHPLQHHADPEGAQGKPIEVIPALEDGQHGMQQSHGIENCRYAQPEDAGVRHVEGPVLFYVPGQLPDGLGRMPGRPIGPYPERMKQQLSLENSLENKVCLVTGGTRGIGRAIAEMLLQKAPWWWFAADGRIRSPRRSSEMATTLAR